MVVGTFVLLLLGLLFGAENRCNGLVVLLEESNDTRLGVGCLEHSHDNDSVVACSLGDNASM